MRFQRNTVPPWLQAGGVVLAGLVLIASTWRNGAQQSSERSAAISCRDCREHPVTSSGGTESWSAADTFPHARHERLSCLACHEEGSGHGRLTFEPPRGCAVCHHRAPASAKCGSCHRTEELEPPQQATVTVTVPTRQPRPRVVAFLHSSHVSLSCVECHTTPVTLAPAPDKAQCTNCHGEHHAAGRSCSSCHAGVQPRTAHETLDVAHQRCDACHTTTTIARLTPTRSFCSTCHTEEAREHHIGKECSVCHFLAEPDAYRSKLVRPLPG